MTSADNKEVVRRYQTAWEKGDLSTLDELLADEFVNHSAPLPPTKAETLEFAARHRRQFPDGAYNTRQIIAEDDLVFVFGNYYGVHTGEPVEGMPASGAVADFDYFILLRLTNGKIIERRGAADDVMGMLIPLGYKLVHPGGR
jgi:ketosteroid isomerase-like protein